MVKLSIIIPVYNVAPYLRKCVESLIEQDFSNYEIILVDDGSTDGSGELCDKIVRANDGMSRADALNEPHTLNDGKPIIRVIHQENGGLSAARNAGLNEAKGEFVCFVDSDDYWEENVLGKLMVQVDRENLDVLRFDYQNVRIVNSEELIVNSGAEGVRYEVFLPNRYPHQIDTQIGVVDGETYIITRMGYACYAWQFIINRSLLIKELESESVSELEGDCLFREGIHYEDVDWLPRMMLRAKRVNSTTTTVYNYLVRQGSITKTQGDKTKIRKNLEDSILIIDKYRQYREQYPKCTWLYDMQSSMVAGGVTTIAREFYAERNEYIKRLRDMNVFPLRIADQGKTYRRRALLINLLGADLYCRLMRYL